MVPQYARRRNRARARTAPAAAGARRRQPAQRARGRHRRSRHHRLGRRVHVRARGLPQGLVPEAGHVEPAALREGRQALPQVSRVAVVEELDPFIEEQVRALGLPVVGKEAIPADGELDQEIVFSALEPYVKRRPPRRRRPVVPPAPRLSSRRRSDARAARAPARAVPGLPAPRRRTPCCASTRWRRMGDIGCYTLGALPPLLALDSCLCMGASVGMMAGLNKALGRKAAVAVHRRLDVLPFGRHAAHRRALQRDRGPGRRARQPHHGDDRPSGPPRHRACTRSSAKVPASTSSSCARASACEARTVDALDPQAARGGARDGARRARARRAGRPGRRACSVARRPSAPM